MRKEPVRLNKPLLIIVTIIAGVLAVNAYVNRHYVWPRVKVENLTEQMIHSVVITMPIESVEFVSIEPGEIHLQNYSLRSSKGHYEYTVKFASGNVLRGMCGNINSYEIGKVFLFTVRSEIRVTCNS